MPKLLLGPLLGLEAESKYTVSFLSDDSVNEAVVIIDGNSYPAELTYNLDHSKFWRVSITIASNNSSYFTYLIHLNGESASDIHLRHSWEFYSPGENENPKISYTSCNGFSKADHLNTLEAPYHLWTEMKESHKQKPFSLLIMGGDQVYADSIWSKVKSLERWCESSRHEKIKYKSTIALERELDTFYENLYRTRWSNKDMSLMLASIPSIMMWDDHDIFDGWGSFPEEMQSCDVYQTIFKYAKKYFEIFQIRGATNESLFDNTGDNYSFSINFRNYNIVALDNRSKRSIQQVMSSSQWQDFSHYLSRTQTNDLIILSAVPIVYRDFSFSEAVFDATPWEEELTDDLKDHWRAKEHEGERARLIMNVLNNAKQRGGRTMILSGDVHIGCLGVIQNNREGTKIQQIVSSGIVHPAPSAIQWFGIQAVTNDNDEYLDENETIKTSMLKPFGSNKYIRARNFVTLEEGRDNKIWVNWICEDKDNPCYPIG